MIPVQRSIKDKAFFGLLAFAPLLEMKNLGLIGADDDPWTIYQTWGRLPDDPLIRELSAALREKRYARDRADGFHWPELCDVLNLVGPTEAKELRARSATS